MSLNIKNEDAHRLAQELAALTDESMATAVTQAIKEKLERIRSEQELSLSQRLLAIGRDCAKRFPEPIRSLDHGDLLYGEDGLPR